MQNRYINFSYSTLFNINYIDKGIALYNSIRNTGNNSTIYILCLDEVTKNILEKNDLVNVELITIKNIEEYYPYLNNLKNSRSFAEYCWTLTPHIVEYVFSVYKEEYNTYLDSDLWFYRDPDLLNMQMIKNSCHTLITRHNFKNDNQMLKNEILHGRYCVQFNTFTNNLDSKGLLIYWKESVIADCEYNKKKQKAGDQKYLENFINISKDVYIPEGIGVGVAPWNIEKYRLVKNNKSEIIISDEEEEDSILFYHFQNIKYLSERLVNLGAGKSEKELKYSIYLPYLKAIHNIRSSLKKEKIQIEPRSVSRSRCIAFIQKYLVRFKVKNFSISDIVIVKK